MYHKRFQPGVPCHHMGTRCIKCNSNLGSLGEHVQAKAEDTLITGGGLPLPAAGAFEGRTEFHVMDQLVKVVATTCSLKVPQYGTRPDTCRHNTSNMRDINCIHLFCLGPNGCPSARPTCYTRCTQLHSVCWRCLAPKKRAIYPHYSSPRLAAARSSMTAFIGAIPIPVRVS